MSALSPQWTPDVEDSACLSGSAFPSATGVEMRVEGACRCGRRRPVGVWLGMRSGARPRFEGRWYCRRSCLREALEERARRDFPETQLSFSRVRHRVPLGLMLQARSVITAEQLQGALRVQSATGQRLGDVLQTRYGVPEERITGAIAAQWGLPLLHLPMPSAIPALGVAPLRLFQASGTFPVERTSSTLLLACAEGPDPALALALERMHPLRVEFGLVSSAALEQWRNLHAEVAAPVQRVRCTDRQALADEVAETLYRLQPVESRIIRVSGFWWMRAWLEEAARLQDSHADTVDVLYSLPEQSDMQRLQNA